MRPTTLRALAADLPVTAHRGDLDVTVLRAVCDPAQVRPGDLFAVIVDVYRDHRLAIPAAIEAGAVALLVGAPPGAAPGVPWLAVSSVAGALGQVCAALEGHPARDLALVGVTGTNGKTTTCHLLESVFAAAGRRPGLLGTVTGARFAGAARPTGLTTPEAPELQAVLAAMVAAGVDAAAMEVSSHGIALDRVEGCEFAVGVLTTIGTDHLDFHGDHAAYVRTKVDWLLGQVASSGRCRGLVLPADDPHGAAAARRSSAPTLTFATASPADVVIDELVTSATGSRGVVSTPAGAFELDLPMPGHHNVRNALAATAAALLLDVPLDAIAEGLTRVGGVPGRFQSVPNDRGVAVLVDYAHTPDALAAALAAARGLTAGRLLVVFGCGGDRDRRKRPEMGALAAEGADVVVVTSDNPRSEVPAAIVDEILAGVSADGGGADLRAVVEREAAIALALGLASPGDTVLIAGKGHESGQTTAGVTVPFDDVGVAARLLAVG